MQSSFFEGRSARRRNTEFRLMQAEQLERRDLMAGDGLAMAVEAPATSGPTLKDVLAAPVYGPVYPVQVDTTLRLTAPAPAPSLPSVMPSLPPAVVDRVFTSEPLPRAEGEEPGGGTNQQVNMPIIDEFFMYDEYFTNTWYFVGHVAYSDPQSLTVRFDTLLAGHSTSPDYAGDFIYGYRYTPGEYGIVGATAYGPNGIQSNRAEVVAI
jgi:hypothetical protein